MADQMEIFVPADRDDKDRQGLFSGFAPGTRTLPAGFQVGSPFKPLPANIVFDKDVAVTLRDGTVIYADVFRPAGEEKVPVIVAWSPYGKSRGNARQYVELFALLGMDTQALSGLHKFEGPDPAYWCARGYAVCNPDPRGSYHSDGDIRVWSRAEGEDYHDLIEWLGVQDWCTGKVGLTGNSYLAISQWFAAAERPPHLAAIAPWEGMSDIYRDLVVRGGIPDPGFARRLASAFVGNNRREDLVAEADAHPLVDALWRSKIPAFEQIDVPAYVVASYSNSIHTPGTFRGWRRIASAEKWLRIHGTMEWPDYYEDAHVEDLRRFFDCFLKGADNGWRATPRVRYAVLDLAHEAVEQAADQFPPADFPELKLYLDADTGRLAQAEPATAAAVGYAAGTAQDSAAFVFQADRRTEFVGYPKARLWVEAQGHDDLDLFVFLQKLDSRGEQLEQFTIPNHGPQVQAVTRNGAAILKYKGSNGRLRASMRRLDQEHSTDAVPAHSFDQVEKLSAGEIVCVEIDLFPVGLVLAPGEQLRFVVSGRNLVGGAMPGTEDVVPDNRGRHVVHTGGDHASYVQITARMG